MAALADLKLIASGKVRDIYDLGDELLLVATDRISTFDVVHPNPIPDKGAVLTGISSFWFEQTADIVPNHVVSVTDGVPDEFAGRAMIVKKLRMLPVEAIVRGYITGSGWKGYQQNGAICGLQLPDGLVESEQLHEPLYTPSTKPEVGHDEPISFEQTVALLGDRALAEQLREAALSIYRFAHTRARARGVILADTKFEFGLDSGGQLTLADELCTPDSSRFWPADGYAPGRRQASFDKQEVRDWAAATGWDKTPPAPEIPAEVVAKTRAKYIEAYERITGQSFDDWLSATGKHAAPPTPSAGGHGGSGS